MIEATESKPFGGINEAELGYFAQTYNDGDPELAAPEMSIAIESVASAVAARIDNLSSATDPKFLAIFIVTDRSRILASQLNAAVEPILNNGARALCSQSWLIGPSCTSGYRLQLAGTDNGEIFKEIEDKGLGAYPAIVFDPSATQLELRYYKSGLSDHEDVRSYLLDETSFTLEKLDEVVSQAYEEGFKTADASRGSQIWSDAPKYFPGPNTEASFQHLIKFALSIAFHPKRFSVAPA